METVSFPASLEIATPSNAGRLVLGGGLLVLSAVSIAWGMYTKRPVTLALVFLLVYALSMIRGARGGSQVAPVQATLEVQSTRLELRLPGTKLVGDRYITQIYYSEIDDMDAVGFLEGKVMLRSHLFTSVGVDGTQVVSNRRMENTEVTLYVSPSHWDELQAFFTSHGMRVFR